MPDFSWQRRPTKHFGEVPFPIADVALRGMDGRFRSFAFQIDSGAVVSLLRRSAGELLGIAVQDGRRIELISVGGATTVAFVHQIATRFSESMLGPVEYAISESENVPNLLGRRSVFEQLHISFDSTLARTTILNRWMDNDAKRLFDVLCDASERVASSWNSNPLPGRCDEAAGQLLRRGEQLFATAVALMKGACSEDAPLIVRAMFELSLQFEYLLQSPEAHGLDYLDFAKVTKHLQVMRIAENPCGPIGRRISESPMRAEGEIRNKAEFDRVAARFRRGNSYWDRWYRMSLADLAERLGKRSEYDIWYKLASGWAHADPFVTERVMPFGNSTVTIFFQTCLHFLGRMFYELVEAKQIVIASEQFELLKACLQKLD